MKISSKEGAGGKRMQEFLENFVLKTFGPASVGCIGLKDLDDGASFENYVITSDGHTIKPIFFRGGNIGKLAACGTINDISVMGAKPLLLTCSIIIQAGFESRELMDIMASIRDSCNEVGIHVVTGDTKVVEDPINIYITTTGIGKSWKGLKTNLEKVRETRNYPENFIKDSNLKTGDVIIVSGTIGDHGISILSERDEIAISGDLHSDVSPIWDVVKRGLKKGGITAMKDPTRGGLSSTLNEMSQKSGFGIEIEEERIPVDKTIVSAAKILGINILDVANEGKVVFGVMPEEAESVLKAIKKSKYGSNAAIIGKVINEKKVFLKTGVGARRLLEMPDGDPVPRVC
ncbi:MAG: hydrogenase expression/formation protein HypE [Candidatus Methanofastidiosia archaeon]